MIYWRASRIRVKGLMVKTGKVELTPSPSQDDPANLQLDWGWGEELWQGKLATMKNGSNCRSRFVRRRQIEVGHGSRYR
jgi:hypothetical protein